ncbi:hypothetical protein [Cellulophaga baltica]|uniref:hypothetical protein n=1 Tax=Cellulophaga baltica TaxID=76594 RepID=UPI0024948C81|nr:hypothetical protein [Cellulophaga baltica]
MALKLTPILIILLQIISCIWYLIPSVSQAHIPGGFIKMIIFGGIALVLLTITSFFYFIKKPSGILWKISFVISLVMFLLAWFYDT